MSTREALWCEKKIVVNWGIAGAKNYASDWFCSKLSAFRKKET
jgi:hypothetical protein